jgi:hypothetical protein
VAWRWWVGRHVVTNIKGQRMRRPTFLRYIASCIAAEHHCAPPDELTAWTFVSLHDALQYRRSCHARDRYECPECGAHMMRAEAQKRAA